MDRKQKVFDKLKKGFTTDEVLVRIMPKYKKSITQMIQLYNVPVGQPGHRFVEVKETYRWGYGYREGDDLNYPSMLFPQNGEIFCDPSIGHGAELDDLCAIDFDFDGDWTDEEMKDFEDKWYNGDPDDDDGRSGLSWVYDYQDTWKIEDEELIINGPVRYDIVDINVYDKIYESDYRPKVEEKDEVE